MVGAAWSVVLLLAACNQLLGIDRTEAIDPALVDAAPDAPRACPASYVQATRSARCPAR